MSRIAASIVCGLVSCALAACSESAPPASTGGQAGAAAGSSGGGSGGTAGATSPVGAGGSGAASGASGAGSGGSGGGGSGGGAGGASGASGAAGAGGCAPPAIICDDFEKYADGVTDLSPDWIAYTYGGTVTVDGTKPRAGSRSLHVTTEQGMRKYADIIRETPNQELMPLRHFGRVMVWLSNVPQGAEHWNINIAGGPVVDHPEEIAKYAEGGMFGKLMSNFAERERAMEGDQVALRGGGPENGDAAVDSDCAVAAPTQTIEAGKWVCWEWEFDGTTNSAHLWLDGVAMTEIDAEGFGTQCQGPGFNGIPMAPDYPWNAPMVWDKLVIGYEQYQDMPAQEAWIDDVVISSEKVGCPPP